MGFPYGILNTLETVGLTERFLFRTVGFDSQNGYMEDATEYVENKHREICSILGITKGSDYTQEIDAEDDEFKKATQLFRDTIFLKSQRKKRPEIAEKAALLASVFNEFGLAVYDLPRNEQIVKGDAMVHRFASAELQEAIGAIDVADLWEDFRETHTTLKALIRERMAEQDDKNVTPASQQARELAKILDDLFEHVESYSRIGNEKYQELQEQLKLELNEVLPQAKARRTRRDSE